MKRTKKKLQLKTLTVANLVNVRGGLVEDGGSGGGGGCTYNVSGCAPPSDVCATSQGSIQTNNCIG